MVGEIRIYVEGGGDDADGRALIREGFNDFLSPLCDLAQQRGIRWNLTACGPRNRAFDMFKTAVKKHPDALVVLLVDSEGEVNGSPDEHLRSRDAWDTKGLAADRLQLMVQTVEAWLIADPEALSAYYGQGFLLNALPNRKNVEEIPKKELERCLLHATSKTKTKGPYHKIRHCADLLSRLSSAVVRQRAKHCDRLFTCLESYLTGPTT